MNIKSLAIEILQPYEKNFKSVEDIYAILKTQDLAIAASKKD